jgi:parallel beta-helix repeat protein
MKTLPKVLSGGLLVLCATILLPASAAAQAVLSVTPTSISVQTNVGTNAPSQTVQVRKSGAGALRWTVEPPAAGWLTVAPTSGTNNVTLTLTFQTSGLAVQSQAYTTSFRVVSGTQAVTVNVSVTIVGSAPPQLIANCPSNTTAASPDGNPVPVTYTIPTPSGGTPPYTTSGSPASGSSFPVGTTSVRVTAQSSDGQTASCTFSVTVTYSATSVSPDGAMVPTTTSQIVDNTGAVWTIASNGAILRNGASAAGGFGSKIYWKDNTIYVYGTDSIWYQWTGSGWVTFGPTQPGTTTSPPPSTSAVGPTSTITCPTGAINIFPGTSIQTVVNNNPINTTFCLKSGIHYLTSPITPKGGDIFIGEYGAIVDGTGWATNNDFDAAFRALDQDIDYVTIRNLVIRNLRRGIHAGSPSTLPDHWTIENNEIGPNYSGVLFPSFSLLRNNYIHDNPLFGDAGVSAHNSLLENNEIARNGWEQKIALSSNVTFRNNFVHHNAGAGIWYDSDNTGGLVEGNRVEDNGWIGIFYEISTDGIIRNNTVRRSGDAGVFLSTSKNTQVYNNTLENNFRGITYFLNCGAVGGGSTGWDLTNNTSHDNTITVDTTSGAVATVFSYISECASTFVEPYKNGSKNLTFSHNTYDVPSPATGQYWYWAALYNWSGWQALGFDTTGTVK